MTDAPVKRKPGRPKGSTKASGATTAKKIPTTAKGLMAEYLRLMPKATPNDYAMLENLVAMEMEMKRVRGIMPDSKDGLESRKMAEAISTLSKEHRLVQESLGIARSQRSTDIDMQKEVDALVAESTELVAKVGTQIACGFCTSEYEMGVIIFHFRDDVPWAFVFNCPACAQTNTIEGVIPYEPEPTSAATATIAGSFSVTDGSAPGEPPAGDRDLVEQQGQISGPIVLDG